MINSANEALKPLNMPKVMMYSRVMNQVSGLAKMSICWRMFAVTGTSFRTRKARMAAEMLQGTKKIAALCTHRLPLALCSGAIQVMPNNPKPISSGPMSWMMDMPRLPMPAWIPNAVPCRRLGKKYPVLGM